MYASAGLKLTLRGFITCTGTLPEGRGLFKCVSWLLSHQLPCECDPIKYSSCQFPQCKLICLWTSGHCETNHNHNPRGCAPCCHCHVVRSTCCASSTTWESMRTRPECGLAPQTDEHIAKLTVQETMDFSAWVQGTELREGTNLPLSLPPCSLLQTSSFAQYGRGLVQELFMPFCCSRSQPPRQGTCPTGLVMDMSLPASWWQV